MSCLRYRGKHYKIDEFTHTKSHQESKLRKKNVNKEVQRQVITVKLIFSIFQVIRCIILAGWEATVRCKM